MCAFNLPEPESRWQLGYDLGEILKNYLITHQGTEGQGNQEVI